jgi:hypothetical protein
MLKFPVPPSADKMPLPKMSLLEYARFSERCLQSNPAVTAENCLVKRADEARMQPFRMPPRPAPRE